jgi:peptide/nickel transport system substrate-binding protein
LGYYPFPRELDRQKEVVTDERIPIGSSLTSPFNIERPKRKFCRRTKRRKKVKTNSRLKILGTVIAILAVSLLTTHCGPAATPTEEAAPPPTPTEEAAPPAEVERPLVVAILADPENLDPQQYESVNAWYVDTAICEGLWRMKPGTTDFEPVLAESWEVSDDGLHYTFHLRKGVTFHDGTPFNAEVAKWNIDRQMPGNPYYEMGVFWLTESYWWQLESAEVVDEYTFRINLTQPSADFFPFGIYGQSFMVSPTAVDEYKEDFVEHPVCTGPYKFVKWDKGYQIVLERFDDYWGEKPAIKDVVFRIIQEEMPKLSAFLASEVHLAPETGAALVQELQRSENHHVVSVPTGAAWWFAPNVNWEPFQDVRVRRALNHAINKETIVHDILKDTVDIAHGPIAPAYKCYNPDITVYEYDPEKAKELLAEAGYPDGFEVMLSVPASGSGMLASIEMATSAQADLAAVGIKVNLDITDFVTWMDAVLAHGLEFTEASWNVPSVTEADILECNFGPAGLAEGGWGYSQYDNPRVNELLLEASQTLDPDERCPLIQEVQKIITDEAVGVFVCHAKWNYGLDNRLEGFNPTGDMQLMLHTLRWKE